MFKKPGARRADATNLNDAPLVETERILDDGTKRIGDLNSSWHSVGFHTRGHVYGIAPDVVGESGVTDDACRGAAGVEADPQRKMLTAQRGEISLGSQDREGEPRSRDGLTVRVAGQAADRHVAIADSLDLLNVIFGAESIEAAHHAVEIIDDLLWRQIVRRLSKSDDIGEQDR